MNGPTELTDPSPGRVPLWRNGLFLLGVLAAVEALAFAFMAWPGKETFDSLTTFADTGPYVQLAGDLLKTGAFQPNCRTVGYPLFLAPGLLLGEYHYYAIAAQMLLNLGLVAIFWRLLGHLQVGPKIKVLFAALFAVAGLGMAIYVLSDFLGGFLFALFAYALLLKRSWTGALLGGLCLALCIVVRPAFMFLVPLMPVIAYLAGKFAARKLPLAHLGVYLAAGTLALTVNYAQERALRDSVTPPGHPLPFMVGHIRIILYKDFHQDLTDDQWRKEYARRISQVGGRPYDLLTRVQQERAARELLKKEILGQPARFIQNYTVNFLKYLFCPVESIAQCASNYYNTPMMETGVLRWALTIFWLPLWVACMIPPRQPKHRGLYYLAMLCLLSIVAMSALSGGAGERYRFPALVLTMAVGAVNVTAAGEALRKRRVAQPRTGGPPSAVSYSDKRNPPT